MVAGIFQPTVLDWLFGNGIGTNLGASIVCWVIGFGTGMFLGRRAFSRLHDKLDEHHHAHMTLHRSHHTRLERLERKVNGGDDPMQQDQGS